MRLEGQRPGQGRERWENRRALLLGANPYAALDAFLTEHRYAGLASLSRREPDAGRAVVFLRGEDRG
jgi:hypothetical protein